MCAAEYVPRTFLSAAAALAVASRVPDASLSREFYSLHAFADKSVPATRAPSQFVEIVKFTVIRACVSTG